jgi:hypothetical protein
MVPAPSNSKGLNLANSRGLKISSASNFIEFEGVKMTIARLYRVLKKRRIGPLPPPDLTKHLVFSASSPHHPGSNEQAQEFPSPSD